jgi:hypothetical protein
MPGSFHKRLQAHEEIPPASVWNKISKRLDEEFTASDNILSAKLDDLSVAPPASAWSNIATALEGERPGKVIPLFRRIAVAVIVAGVVALGALYFLNSNNMHVLRQQQAAIKRPPADTPSAVASAPDVQTETHSRKIAMASAPRAKHVSYSPKSISRPPQAEELPAPEFTNEGHTPTLEPEQTLPDITVSAPPIKDKSGNIIMDLKLVSEPNQPYITVTSPSGNQTRLSNKFLNCLSYINDNSGVYEDPQGAQCQSKFDRWREKLLTEAAFIPTATNFLDIFELKDILQD